MTAKAAAFDDICYKKSFLDKVIVRVDFSSPVEAFKLKLPTSLESLIIKDFPIPEPHKSLTAAITISAGNKPEISQTEGPPTWVFHSKDKERILELSSFHLALVFNTYNSYEDLESAFKKLSDEIFNIDGSIVANRIGIRYINIIKVDDDDEPYDFDKFINKKLTCSINIPEDKKTIARVFTTLVLNYDDVILQAQFGIFNPDFPAKIKKKEFIIDLDAHYRGLVEKDDVLNILSTSHNYIQAFFEDSITDETRKRMR